MAGGGVFPLRGSSSVLLREDPETRDVGASVPRVDPTPVGVRATWFLWVRR